MPSQHLPIGVGRVAVRHVSREDRLAAERERVVVLVGDVGLDGDVSVLRVDAPSSLAIESPSLTTPDVVVFTLALVTVSLSLSRSVPEQTRSRTSSLRSSPCHPAGSESASVASECWITVFW